MFDVLSPLPAGTQVVVLAAVLGSQNVVIHPRGAVGLVTRTPTRPDESYSIRFPDGCEAVLPREQLEVLRHFKNRPDAGKGSEPFSVEDHVIYRGVVGSRAYGLESEESDFDRRGVYVAPAEMHWSLFGAPDQFEDHAGQWCVWELQKFVVMALKANPNILECLYSPLVDRLTRLGAQLLDMRERFLSKLIFQTFNGYAMSQFKLIERDQRNRGEVRWKHAMHLLRLLLGGAAALREGRVPVRMHAHRERLLAVKCGATPWSEVEAWRVALHADFERALGETRLPDRPDYEAANQFLVQARRQLATPHERTKALSRCLLERPDSPAPVERGE